jgi:hypothetical protein
MRAGHLDIAPQLAGNRAGPRQHSYERNLAHPDTQVRTNLTQDRSASRARHLRTRLRQSGPGRRHGSTAPPRPHPPTPPGARPARDCVALAIGKDQPGKLPAQRWPDLPSVKLPIAEGTNPGHSQRIFPSFPDLLSRPRAAQRDPPHPSRRATPAFAGDGIDR